ncbi:MAG: hypothetical protein ACKVHR_08570 [Pirellulales bacterium]|jgi:hypothetical protein
MISDTTNKFASSAVGCFSTNFLAARHNPLCCNRVSKLGYRFAQHDWPRQLARLQELQYRAAIVGQQGSGKTTLLSELVGQLDGSNISNHHVFLPRETTEHRTIVGCAIKRCRRGAVILVDGVERLGFIQRRRLVTQTKRGPGLVVAVHRPCKLSTWVHCRTNPELMRSVLLDLGLRDPAILASGNQAFENSGGNIREALRELYDQFASGRFNDILSA